MQVTSDGTHSVSMLLHAQWQQRAVTHQGVIGQVDDLQKSERVKVRHLLQLVALQKETPQPWTQTCQGGL